MKGPEGRLIDIIKKGGIDFTCSLPCEKIKTLLEMVGKEFFHVPLTREEEGVGICAGAALAGRWPAMFVQSSGVGNMINALLSLTGFYRLPLAIFVSHRGVYKEKIEAQIPMGRSLPGILRGAGIGFTPIDRRGDLGLIQKRLKSLYQKEEIHAFLLSPRIWERGYSPLNPSLVRGKLKEGGHQISWKIHRRYSPRFTRFEILNIIVPFLDSKAVVCNLGFPSKELYHIRHQPSNFYMLGSMGMATPIGLGIALTTKKEVVVIEGDGSLLMNPGSLSTVAYLSPENLTIFAIDNGTYGSTGNQPTLTSFCVDLEVVARGFGIRNTFKVATKKELVDVMKDRAKGLRFIHALAIPGNKDIPNIPLNHLENKRQFQGFLTQRS